MGEIVDFPERTEANDDDPYMHGPAICIGCRHEWEAVAPLGATQLECPCCGSFKGVWKHPAVDASRPIWECQCGNEFFAIHDDRIVCAACGIPQRFPEID